MNIPPKLEKPKLEKPKTEKTSLIDKRAFDIDQQRRLNDLKSLRNFLFYLCIPILIVSALAAFIISAIYLVKVEKMESFESVTNFEPDSTSSPIINGQVGVSRIEDFNSVNAIPCTNKTLGDERRVFSGITTLGLPCPKSDNPCSNFVCGIDGYCNEQAIEGGECFSDMQCGAGSVCNSTCLCSSGASCTLDSDCPQFNANPCIETKCIGSMCSDELIAGAECSSTTDCNEGYGCNSTCSCYQIQTGSICTLDSDCQQFNANPCIEAKCISGSCSDELIAGAECSSPTQCGNVGLTCNSTCMCQTISTTSGCNVDSDCQQVNLPCATTTCNMTSNQCTIDLLPGAECFASTQCNSGFSCNSTCMCDLITESAGCVVDGDCQNFTANPCIEARCISNLCTTQLTAGAECSSTTGCSSGLICNSTCGCEALASTSTFSDADFAVFDDVTPDKIFNLNLSVITSTTNTYTLDPVTSDPSDTLRMARVYSTSGSTSPNINPWSGSTQFPASWKIEFVSGSVTFSMVSNIQNTGTFVDNPIVYSSLIPAGYRPPNLIAYITLVQLNNVPTAGLCTISTGGTLACYSSLTSNNFPMTNTQGHNTINFSWLV